MPVFFRKLIHVPAFLIAKTVWLWKKIVYQFGRLFAYLSIALLRIKKAEIDPKTKNLAEFYPDRGADPSDEDFIIKNPEYDLSLIIPAYNVISYIDDCMAAIFAQKTKYTFEVLVVDDGSTDGTSERLAEYASKDERIKIITQENQGRAVACNNGVIHSSGKYIMFYDADDLISDDAIESLLSEAYRSGSDIVEGKFVDYYEGQPKPEFNSPRIPKTKTYSYKKNPNFVLTSYGYSWGKVYKRELWRSVRFPNGYFFQDIVTKFALKRIANQVTYINKTIAGYLHRSSSSSHGSGKSLKALDIIWLCPRVLRISDRAGAPRDNTLYMLALNHIGIFSYLALSSVDAEIQKSGFAEMQKQLISIQDIDHKKLPMIFRRTNEAVLSGDIESWKKIASKVHRYRLLSKHREIN